MSVKCYRTNTAFDIATFLAQEAKTPDGKYVLYTAQKNILEENQSNFQAIMMRKKAQFMRLEIRFNNLKNLIDPSEEDKIEFLETQADMLSISAGLVNDELNMRGGEKEIADLGAMIQAVKPLCRYAHLPLLEQQEMVQEQEWLLELIERAKDHLICTGTVPVDQFKAMRAHPQFLEKIVPAIREFSSLIGGTVFSQVLSLSVDETLKLPPIEKDEKQTTLGWGTDC